MFLGHETLAFALVALVATLCGVSRERALALGVAAGLFAFVPDADMVYALAGFLRVDSASAFAAANAFWSASTAVHRSITHSLVLAGPAAAGFALVAATSRFHRALGALLLAGLVGVAFVASGPLGVLVTVAFALAGLGVVALATRRLDLGSRAVGATALVGLVSHPFGDLLTGHPPAFFYPFEVTLLAGRPAPFGDPTLNLLAAFAFELAAIWAGLVVFLALTDRRFRGHLAPRAAAGGAYALAALVIQPPTLETSYQFVFSVLAVGSVGLHPRSLLDRSLPDPVAVAVTGLTAITVAGAGYTVAYLLALT
ncbi:metal-dependent hydrolase [Halospeciosus flavus]|uniref:Metal-dependent hydrolase n=1 Tax=Halospeciosus flavus TaxID=3032283 RepID=A0ABD5Z8Y5_9EURY|nr:metal-dependent hydrolase [Halospeciosus flavus]